MIGIQMAADEEFATCVTELFATGGTDLIHPDDNCSPRAELKSSLLVTLVEQECWQASHLDGERNANAWPR